MVKEAEDNAEADKKLRELVETRNNAEAGLHNAKKDFDEHGKELDDEAKSKIETAFKDLEESIKGEDKEVISTKVSSMYETLAPLYEAKNKAEQPKTDPQTVDVEAKEV